MSLRNSNSYSVDDFLPKTVVTFLFVAATIVYVLGLFVELMDIDASQYASISREMMQNHHYLEVLHRGQNYLDKPPLLFWLSAVSMSLLGVSTAAYKLPTFLFTLLGVYSAYKAGRLLYGKSAGILAALILYTSHAFFLFNNDVRTDALLTGNVMFACWQLLLFSESRKWKNLLLGFLGVALAMMAKGPIGAVVPGAALFCHLLYKRELKKLLWPEWYAGIAFAFVLMMPMLYGLYEQYGADGPKFFLWTQSFGRITGENIWRNNAGYFYFLHNFAWSFLPWTLLSVTAFIIRIFDLIRNGFRKNAIPEAFSIGGFVLPFIALSFSHYKLPHYIFVVYPLCAVFTAGFIIEWMARYHRLLRIFIYVQLVVATGAILLAVYLSTVNFPMANIFYWGLIVLIIAMMVYCFVRYRSHISRLILPSAFAVIGVNFLFNIHVYPSLLKYQSGSELAKTALRENIKKDELYFYEYHSHAFEFCYGAILPLLTREELLAKVKGGASFSVVGSDDLINLLKKYSIQPKKIIEADDFSVTLLTVEFLNPKTRESELRKRYLIEL
jgi:4-amino-4-deoxy-L-arabinose transferase-like glycosyltransferase